jgi:hypothetical protein
MKKLENADGTIEEVSNVEYKKKKAVEHNATLEIAENILHCGTCSCEEGEDKCNGLIFMYLKSEDANIFKYYHDQCTEIGDIRNAKISQDHFMYPLGEIMVTLADKYGPDKIERLQDED